MQSTGIDHVNLHFPVDRLDEVIAFYVETFGFEAPFDEPSVAVANDPGLFALALGNGARLFVNPTEEFDPEVHNYRHMALRIPESPSELKAFLDTHDIEIRNTAERHRESVGDYTSYYISDPFNYTIELMAIGE